MRVSREQASANRSRVLDAAARLFRAKGFEGIGVADIMASAGLTHGGFYGQFTSKDALAAEVCARALGASAEKWERLTNATPEPLRRIAADYLSSRHRDDPGGGCVCSTLAADVARHAGPTRGVFTSGLRRLVAILQGLVPERSEAESRDQALATMASLVGAVVLARAVDDPTLSDEILAATLQAVTGRED